MSLTTSPPLRDALAGPWRVLALLPVLVLFAGVGWYSPGFDDEFYTINWIAEAASAAELIHIVDTRDVHPPGSYLIVSTLHEMGLSFSAIRAFSGGLTALFLWILWQRVSGAGVLAAGVAYLLICLNPTLVLWGATLRWYSWSFPLIVLLFLLVRGGFRNPWAHWGSFGALVVTLGYIGYFNLLYVPGLLGYALWRRRARLRSEWPVILGLGAVSVALLIPQLLYTLPGQMGRGMSVHVSKGLLRRLAGPVLHVFAGHSSMPFGFAALAFSLTTFVLIISAALRRQLALGSAAVLAFVPAIVIAFFGGLTGHFRSMVVLVPFQSVWQSQIFPPDGRLARVLAGGYLVATLAGLWNVVMHEDTTKGGWNAPYWQALARVETHMAACEDPAVFTYDPVMLWHLTQAGHKVLTVERWTPDPEGAVSAHAGCLVVVRTFHRMLNSEFEAALSRGLAPHGVPLKTESVGFDRHAWFKRRFDPRIPDHPIILQTYSPR